MLLDCGKISFLDIDNITGYNVQIKDILLNALHRVLFKPSLNTLH